MTQKFTKFITTTSLLAAFAIAPSIAAADPILGSWKTESGENADISSCGSAFCIKLTTGKYNGKQIGRLKGANGQYDGSITDPSDDKEYAGSAIVRGKSLKLKGCALKIFCKTQNWRKL